MKRLLLVLCCVPLLVFLTAAAEVYKWKDKNGKWQYSDSPPVTNVPYSTLSGKVSSPQPTPTPEAAAGKEGAAAGKDGKAQDPKDKAAQDANKKKQDEEKAAAEAKAKEEKCKQARVRLAQFQQGGRIYRSNEKGDREYYGDKEIAAEIQNAQGDVDANCPP
ncbi:MAG: DUF4124 domain-containing protein [Methylobacillus sp.]|jgi:hypothetical protein|nr:DUF4124 domain-containing protein [Methylobacillus sp.]